MASCVRASFPAGKARVARGLERGATGGIIFRLCNTNKKEKKHKHMCVPQVLCIFRDWQISWPLIFGVLSACCFCGY